jgi:hypothetical protein
MAEMELIQWFFNQGVAVAVTAFLLWRIEGKLDDVITKLEQLSSKLS